MQAIANEFDLFWVQFVSQYDSNDSIRYDSDNMPTCESHYISANCTI